MAKRHTPRRYRNKPPPAPAFALSGKVFLQYEEEEALAAAGKGDVCLYLRLDRPDRGEAIPDYHAAGHAGCFRAAVHDGKDWKPLLTDAFFSAKEHRFTRKERPWDRFLLCRDILRSHAGTPLIRSYREHYERAADQPGERPPSP